MKAIKKYVKAVPLEAWMWIGALLYLVFVNPYKTQSFTFCPFHNMGIEHCPGCGLGRSISFIYHGDIIHSFGAHPLGIFALIVIIYRIIDLIRNKYQTTQGEVKNA